MTPDSRIYVAGHGGLVGSAIVRALLGNGYTSILTRTHSELDLTDQRAVESFFQNFRPEVVFLAAARVGGILANDTYPAEFIQDNLAIQTNVIHAAWRAGVNRLLFFGAACMYPRDCAQPIREDYLLTGPIELTNRPYAIAKIAGVEMCYAYNRQYGTNYLCAMPSALYGLGDNYDLQKSHVLPAFIRRFHEAKMRGDKTVVLWGTGAPRREFLYSDDMAAACMHVMELPPQRLSTVVKDSEPPLLNIGCGEDLSIRELAQLIQMIVGTDAAVEWDLSKPDGTPRKLLDVSKMKSLGWRATIELDTGIRRAYADFLSRYPRE